ncbi:hypothetical protein Mbo2_091 [Rhodococcus phage Mbo2]|uniref:Uncharacterized protein n=1 Tax=Rhodococcus phage Mbo2 TaxID=2936911 RepID=A0A9E7IPP2_9CAUD|nr:hypothetical protein Mbo2_091 [Rhodococcus phage Mbo2]
MTAPATENATPEVEADLTEFKAVVELVSGATDETAKDATDKARTVYRDLGRKGMAAARSYLSDLGNKIVLEGDLDKAQKVIKLSQDILKPAPSAKKGGSSANKAPKDPTAEHIDHVAAIQLGYSLSILEAPEGIAEDWRERAAAKADEEAQTQAQEYRRFLLNKQEGTEPNVPEFVKAGARISLGRAPKGQGRKPKAVEETALAAAEAGEAAAATPEVAEAAAPEVAAEQATATPEITQETVDAYTQAVG